MAPEVLTGNVYSESADVYSMGIVLWEMLTGQCPYDGMKQVEIALSVVNNQVRPPIPSQCSQEQALFIQVVLLFILFFLSLFTDLLLFGRRDVGLQIPMIDRLPQCLSKKLGNYLCKKYFFLPVNMCL
jgi:serine/threonine protein kinase